MSVAVAAAAPAPIPVPPPGPVAGQGLTVQESRAKREERLKSRFRDRGGIFQPSTHNALLDALLARGVNGESPTKPHLRSDAPQDQPIAGLSKAPRKSTGGRKSIASPLDAEDAVDGETKARGKGKQKGPRQSTAKKFIAAPIQPHADVEAAAHPSAKGKGKEKPPRKSTARKSIAPQPEGSDSQDGVPQPPAKKGKLKGKNASKAVATAKENPQAASAKVQAARAHLEEDDGAQAGSSRVAKKHASKRMKKAIEEGPEKEHKKAAVPTPKQKAAMTSRMVIESDDDKPISPPVKSTKKRILPDDDDDDDDDHPPPKSKRVKPASKLPAPRAKDPEAAEDDEDAPLAKPPAKRKRVATSRSEAHSDDEPIAKPAPKTKAARSASNLQDDDDAPLVKRRTIKGKKVAVEGVKSLANATSAPKPAKATTYLEDKEEDAPLIKPLRATAKEITATGLTIGGGDGRNKPSEKAPGNAAKTGTSKSKPSSAAVKSIAEDYTASSSLERPVQIITKKPVSSRVSRAPSPELSGIATEPPSRPTETPPSRKRKASHCAEPSSDDIPLATLLSTNKDRKRPKAIARSQKAPSGAEKDTASLDAETKTTARKRPLDEGAMGDVEVEALLRPAKRANIPKSMNTSEDVDKKSLEAHSKTLSIVRASKNENSKKSGHSDKENRRPEAKPTKAPPAKLKPKPKPRMSMFPAPPQATEVDDDPIDFLS